ncbi:MAG TPA: PhoH family protein [Acetomicrobium sp.]|nr:PhoH family protein [Acetomicrobium sp.]
MTGSFNSKGGVQSREDSSPEILVVADEKVLEKILGQRDENIRAVEERFPVRITVRGDEIQVHGPDIEVVKLVAKFLGQLAEVAEKGYRLTPAEVKYGMNILGEGGKVDLLSLYEEVIYITSRGKPVRPRTAGQKKYIEAIRRNEVVFAIGPAGTGKTYLAVAMAVAALKASVVSRIVLVRPVVEAGERLGFLPGDVKEKVEPYLRPLYDAFFELLSPERFMRHLKKNVIELAPLAYMRGRTLNDSFIILDEAQNTTPEQMKMFLTRMGFGSKVVVTGDITQIDLPPGKESGLKVIQGVLEGIPGIEFVFLTNYDVVRHEMVQRIVEAYEIYEKKKRDDQELP